ncbi:MAG: alpha/beta hydrolase [Prevotella sp.]
MKKKQCIISIVLFLLLVVLLAVCGGSMYMLSYSLSPDPNRHDIDSAYNALYGRMPDMRTWTDSVRGHGLLRDTFVVMPSGERHHALYLRADSASGRTAVIVHGYKDCAVKFLHLGRMYHRDLGYNIIMPDLHAHGLSEGDDIQMGWKDKDDVRHWIGIATEIFSTEGHEADIVVHGVSMGAATTMCLSGDSLPENVRCFIEDCGYTSVWDEFALQLKEQFSLPPFPLMYTTSLLCRMKHGWSFGEASPLRQVARCRRPMLFIHGDADTFVPFSMMRPLYDAKPQPKEMLIAHGSEHAKAYNDHMEEYTQAVRRFLSKYNRP